MGIGLSGMISGLDTDSIVKAMVSGQQLKATKVENKITLNKWTTEAWSGLNTKIYSFYTKFASKLRLQSSYMTRTAKSSDESVATATANSSAAVGTHTLEVHKLASSQYVTGAQLKAKDADGNETSAKANYSKTTKLSEMGMTVGATIKIGGKKDVEFSVEAGSTVTDFLNACKDAGLSANFDTSQQRFFISSQESGEANAFTIDVEDAVSVEGWDNITWRIDETSLSEEQKKEYQTAKDTISNALKEDGDVINRVLSADFDVTTATEEEKKVALAVENLQAIAKDSRAEKAAREIVADLTLADDITTEDAIENVKQQILGTATDVKVTVDADKITDTQNTLKALERNINTQLGGLTTVTESADLKIMGLNSITRKEDGTLQEGTGADMAFVEAADAEFVLNGALMTESSNSFTVNGITFNLSKTTESKESTESNKVYDTIQVTVGKDSDSTYNLVKEALTEYNKLIEEMNKLYTADSARGYDPLTDEQKEAMTEDEIKNWEDKIKGSLLRRDNTLGSLLSGMRSALASSYTDEETGKTFSLSSFGIVTGNYTENGKLHIYGDEDDATYATYADRLKKALEEDPDQVMETLTSVFGKLYDTMTEKCAKTEISSALTFYNDKQYNSLLKDYEEDLDTMEERIKDLEDKYYKQFTAMETALSKLQSQQNSLASLLGQTVQQ